jgi:hypothetical protein
MVIIWSRLKLPAGGAFFFLLILSLFSCESGILARLQASNTNSNEGIPDYEGRETGTFFAINMQTNKGYSVPVVHLAENDYCVVYGERSAGIPLAKAEVVASEFKNNIYPPVKEVFGDFRVSLKDKDFGQYKKLTLFLLDIKDGYDPVSNSSYIAGYFYPGDMYRRRTQTSFSNEAAILYMDVYPGDVTGDEFFYTIAHELQHLINCSIRISKLEGGDKNIKHLGLQDTWVDEGLASAAEYLYRNKHITKKIDYFNVDAVNKFSRGDTFFAWSSEFEDYCTVYLFFQWLRIQAGTPEIYGDIINSDKLNYQAVTEAARKYNIDGLDEWEKLLGYWLLANHVNASEGPLGYKGEIVTQIRTSNGKSTSLAPGEGVFSYLDGTGFTPSGNTGPGSHIRYLGVTEKGTFIDTMEGLSGLTEKGRLLTFNANTDNNGSEEQGYLSGKAEPWARTREAVPMRGPMPIDIPPAFFLE